MLKRKKYLLGLLVIALSISFVDSNMVLAASSSTSSTIAAHENGTGKTGIDKNNIKWFYEDCPDGTISIWQYDELSGNIEIPEKIDGRNVSRIKNSGLRESTKITSVKIPTTVKHIGELAFFGCTSLSNIEIPSSVTEIDGNAFENTSWLTNKRNSNPLVVVNNILIDGRNAAGDIVIPSNVTTIGDSAFAMIDIDGSRQYRYGNIGNITSVVIPEGVKKIGNGAFLGCYNLSNITIPPSVVEIGNSAFSGCKASNGTIYIPNSAVKIGDKAFNPNTKVILGSSNSENQTSINTSGLSFGWNFMGNNWYYVNSSGKLQTGWQDLDGKRYYFYGNGQMAVNFINLGEDSVYYLDPTPGSNMGNLITGWKYIDGDWYYFNPTPKDGRDKGYMQTGWFDYNGSRYYFYGNGQMATGFINLGDGYSYYLDESGTSSIGTLKTGWQKIQGKWFYFNPFTRYTYGFLGMMKKGWQIIDGNWYYFYSDEGYMAHDTWIDGYYVNSNGVRC